MRVRRFQSYGSLVPASKDIAFANLSQVELPGSFAVWAASKEARFLHGRYVYATWDVDELVSTEVRERLDADHNYLRPGIVGLTDGGHRSQ